MLMQTRGSEASSVSLGASEQKAYPEPHAKQVLLGLEERAGKGTEKELIYSQLTAYLMAVPGTGCSRRGSWMKLMLSTE